MGRDFFLCFSVLNFFWVVVFYFEDFFGGSVETLDLFYFLFKLSSCEDDDEGCQEDFHS